jgi:L-seryl-tRNA(Ser) seleniumtransferase
LASSYQGAFEMQIKPEIQALLKKLPGIDQLLLQLESMEALVDVPRQVVSTAARQVVSELREKILAQKPALDAQALDPELINARIQDRIRQAMLPNLKPMINATGVVVHTNLGRSCLPDEVLDNINAIAGSYSNLEYDLKKGQRGSRYSAVEALICEITGSQAAMVVNNCAGAVLVCLDTVASGGEVIVSRGELVEIGGSFRIPDVMAKSGCQMIEVGTTNRTHVRDYEQAINADTALLLKVHRSNFSVVGFTKEVSLKELVALGRQRSIPVMEDLGSGTFIDFSQYGLAKEPTVQDSVASGIDLVTFSGDKLLGGPQAGIIVGSKKWVERIKQNPFTRALRIDKMTLAALESVLRLYRDENQAVANLPTLQFLTRPLGVLQQLADRLAAALESVGGDRLEIEVRQGSSKAGGGSLPLLELPTRCVHVKVAGMSPNKVERLLRRQSPPVIVRIEEDTIVIDPRTLRESELQMVADALYTLLDE